MNSILKDLIFRIYRVPGSPFFQIRTVPPLFELASSRPEKLSINTPEGWVDIESDTHIGADILADILRRDLMSRNFDIHVSSCPPSFFKATVEWPTLNNNTFVCDADGTSFLEVHLYVWLGATNWLGDRL